MSQIAMSFNITGAMLRSGAPWLVTRRASAFLRYCRQHANKYGVKGSRMAVSRQTLAVLVAAEVEHGLTAKLAFASIVEGDRSPNDPRSLLSDR